MNKRLTLGITIFLIEIILTIITQNPLWLIIVPLALVMIGTSFLEENKEEIKNE